MYYTKALPRTDACCHLLFLLDGEKRAAWYMAHRARALAGVAAILQRDAACGLAWAARRAIPPFSLYLTMALPLLFHCCREVAGLFTQRPDGRTTAPGTRPLHYTPLPLPARTHTVLVLMAFCGAHAAHLYTPAFLAWRPITRAPPATHRIPPQPPVPLASTDGCWQDSTAAPAYHLDAGLALPHTPFLHTTRVRVPLPCCRATRYQPPHLRPLTRHIAGGAQLLRSQWTDSFTCLDWAPPPYLPLAMHTSSNRLLTKGEPPHAHAAYARQDTRARHAWRRVPALSTAYYRALRAGTLSRRVLLSFLPAQRALDAGRRRLWATPRGTRLDALAPAGA